MIQVIDTYKWTYGKNNCGYGGLTGQVTRCKLDGIEFWIRENTTGIPSFFVSSGERQAEKVGLSNIRQSRQVLELLCHPLYWDRVATLVHEEDSLHRPVVKNRRFNKAFVKKIMQQ